MCKEGGGRGEGGGGGGEGKGEGEEERGKGRGGKVERGGGGVEWRYRVLCTGGQALHSYKCFKTECFKEDYPRKQPTQYKISPTST